LALISQHQNISWSWPELYQRSRILANGLLQLGLKKGDRIGIYSGNCAEWTLVQFAASMCDLILVNVNPSFKAIELRQCLKDAGIKTLVMAESLKDTN